jgi:hypothetical protein
VCVRESVCVGEHMKHMPRGKVQVMTRGTEKAKMEDPGGCTRPPRPSPASVALRSAARARARATFPKLQEPKHVVDGRP